MVKTELKIKQETSSKQVASTSAAAAACNKKMIKKYKGVRMRSWGSWVSEIRAPNQKTRIWLGSYSTAEAAARAYDAALLCLKGSSANLNFPITSSSHYIPSYVHTVMSPKSIQRAAAAAAAAANDNINDTPNTTTTTPPVSHPLPSSTSSSSSMSSPSLSSSPSDQVDDDVSLMQSLIGFYNDTPNPITTTTPPVSHPLPSSTSSSSPSSSMSSPSLSSSPSDQLDDDVSVSLMQSLIGSYNEPISMMEPLSWYNFDGIRSPKYVDQMFISGVSSFDPPLIDDCFLEDGDIRLWSFC